MMHGLANSISSKQLISNIVLDCGITLELDTDCKGNPKLHRGKRALKDLCWYEYKIISNDDSIQYDNIALSPYLIDEDILELARENISKNKVTDPNASRPNIDYKTGNIHPEKINISSDNIEIKQFVLCKGLGPITAIEEGSDDYYLYKTTNRQKGKRVHKACYYPMISEDKSLENNWRQQLLSELYAKLQTL